MRSIWNKCVHDNVKSFHKDCGELFVNMVESPDRQFVVMNYGIWDKIENADYLLEHGLIKRIPVPTQYVNNPDYTMSYFYKVTTKGIDFYVSEGPKKLLKGNFDYREKVRLTLLQISGLSVAISGGILGMFSFVESNFSIIVKFIKNFKFI